MKKKKKKKKKKSGTYARRQHTGTDCRGFLVGNAGAGN